MKLQAERYDGSNAISRHGADGVIVNATAHTQSVVVPWQGQVEPWDVASFADLTAEHFERIARLAPELLIFGSGRRLRFPPPLLLRSLMQRRIGIETMDTPAACRTYNVLLGEGRSVVAALLFDSGG